MTIGLLIFVPVSAEATFVWRLSSVARGGGRSWRPPGVKVETPTAGVYCIVVVT